MPRSPPRREPTPTLPTASISQVTTLLVACLTSLQTLCIWGPPGVGKTSLVARVAADLGWRVETLIASLLDPTDLGGIPTRDEATGTIIRLPLRVIARARAERLLIFLDEITLASPAVQAALLRLVLEGWAGDTKLHPETRFILAGNPPEQALGAGELSAPLSSRLVHVNLVPTISEVTGYLRGLGPPGSSLRALAVEVASAIDRNPNLVQLEPPPGAKLWGNPRSLERAIRVGAALVDAGHGYQSRAFRDAFEGCVGRPVTDGFLSALRLGRSLPTIEEIVADPAGCPIPQSPSTQAAMAPTLRHVAGIDPCAAWLYAARFEGEASAVAFEQVLSHRFDETSESPHVQAALQARRELTRRQGVVLLGGRA